MISRFGCSFAIIIIVFLLKIYIIFLREHISYRSHLIDPGEQLHSGESWYLSWPIFEDSIWFTFSWPIFEWWLRFQLYPSTKFKFLEMNQVGSGHIRYSPVAIEASAVRNLFARDVRRDREREREQRESDIYHWIIN